MINPDVYMNIVFYKTENGGRKGPTLESFYGCFFEYKGKNYDARIILKDIGKIYPGDSKVNVPVKFLYPRKIMHKLKNGTKLMIHEGRCIGEATISSMT